MLYRPFLQHYSHQTSVGATECDKRYFALAMAGVNVCRNIIHIGLEIRRQAVLIGPYWFITYTQFFAILSLVLYVLYNPNISGAAELFADAKLGKECISGLTQKSQAADRVTTALNVSCSVHPRKNCSKLTHYSPSSINCPTGSSGLNVQLPTETWILFQILENRSLDIR